MCTTTITRPWKNRKLTNFLQFLRKLSPWGQKNIRNLDIQVSAGERGARMFFFRAEASLWNMAEKGG
jgi:hypothetical protein